ncbi:uncharacterized protein J4E79_006470 [Alternaria viburni]|uniref:uncharacterized protein n=1 Tax=Alternaria viburni TaxID=566460 RepID=UPI0020C1F983|nr:uncharacterized protein J4E79_006470 [Alternaria viburni]KAI4658712.1 hypothetical protein J4E79_006470 [Alternaria viburni]
MRFSAWLLTTFHVFDVVKGSASVAWSNTTSGNGTLSVWSYAENDCKASPYCDDTGVTGDYDWDNDCPDLPRINYALWFNNRAEDTAFLREKLRHYEQLKMNPWKTPSDELTFPAYMAKRYAPNLPPSSMLCDGLGMCRAPSCKDIGEKLRPGEKRAAMLFLEFVSGLDHSFHITSEALQDHWRHILEDIDQLTRMFTYADEQQEAAIKKDEKKKKALAAMELAFGIITAVFQLFTTAANIFNFRPEIINKYINEIAVFKKLGTKWQRTLSWASKSKIPGSSLAKKLHSRRVPEGENGGPPPDPSGFLRDKSIENLQKLWTITSGGYLGVQGLTKEVVKKIDHKKDLKGFDKTLEAVRAELVELDTNDIDEARAGMPILALGGRSRDGHNIVDLYDKDFFYGANVDFRAYVDFVVGMRTYATIISALWKTEGVYVVETWTKEGGDCDRDNRGPAENKICLPERPDISYWVYAMTNYKDKKNRSPPGWEYLTSDEGFHGLFASDVVRAALWQEEVYWPEREKEERERNSTASGTCPSNNNDLLQDSPALEPVNLDGKGRPDTNVTHSLGSNSTLPPGARKRLDDYGNAPNAFDIAVCRSWMGEAISSTKSTDHNNAPCLCDPINPIYAASWEAPTNWTMAATKKFIKDSGLYNFDSFGKKCHDCDRMDVSWKALLELDDEEEPAKHMKKAWLHDCDPNHHKEHDLGPPQLTNPNSTSSSSVSPGCDPTQAPTPTREPIMQVTTQLLNEETRYPKNTPKNITSQGACNGPYCIVDVVYEIRESHFNYTVDSSVQNGEYGCYPGNDKCVEQSAHDLCDFRDDDDDSEEAKAKEDAEWDREEVGPDDDEYEDFIQENPKGNGTTPGNDKTQNDGTTPGDNGAPNNGTSPDSQDKKKPDNEAMKAFKAWLKMHDKRQACVCGGGGKNGQHGIHCFPGPVATRTTTIKGRMSQTANPLSPLAATPTGAGGGGAAASGTGNVVTKSFTDHVWVDAREVTVEMPSLGTPTETAVFLTGSYASIATYAAAGIN